MSKYIVIHIVLAVILCVVTLVCPTIILISLVASDLFILFPIHCHIVIEHIHIQLERKRRAEQYCSYVIVEEVQ